MSNYLRDYGHFIMIKGIKENSIDDPTKYTLNIQEDDEIVEVPMYAMVQYRHSYLRLTSRHPHITKFLIHLDFHIDRISGIIKKIIHDHKIYKAQKR